MLHYWHIPNDKFHPCFHIQVHHYNQNSTGHVGHWSELQVGAGKQFIQQYNSPSAQIDFEASV